MRASKEELLATLEKIKGTPILVVGDLILDRYIWGSVDRISPEAPVPVVEVSRIEARLGGAGNVARNLATIGAKASIFGFVGDDDDGKSLLGLIDADNILHEGVMVERGRPTCVKTRVIAHRQQVVRIDREDRSPANAGMQEGFSAMVDANIEQAKGLIISDYGKGAITESLIKKLSAAQRGKRLGLGIRPLMVDPHPRNYSIYAGMSIAKPNRKEAEVAAGMKIKNRDSALEAARILLKKWSSEMIVLSLGEDGLLIVSDMDSAGIHLETVAQEVFDVSGAGDTVTAVFLAAVASGAPTMVAGALANIAAGVVVSEVGTVPVNLSRLKQDIERLAAS